MDGNENARERAESLETMEAEAAGTAAPEGGARESVASGRPSFEDAKNGNLTPEQQEELEAAASAAYETIRLTIEQAVQPAFKSLNHLIESMKRTPSSDFDPELHPHAKEGFYYWFTTSPLTLGENGEPTMARLGDLMKVRRQTATEYYKHPEKISQWAAWWLQGNLDESDGGRTYYEIVHGRGTYDSYIAELDKQAAIEEATALLQSKSPEDVGKLLKALKYADYLVSLDKDSADG